MVAGVVTGIHLDTSWGANRIRLGIRVGAEMDGKKVENSHLSLYVSWGDKITWNSVRSCFRLSVTRESCSERCRAFRDCNEWKHYR